MSFAINSMVIFHSYVIKCLPEGQRVFKKKLGAPIPQLPCVLPQKCISQQALRSLPAAAANSTPVLSAVGPVGTPESLT